MSTTVAEPLGLDDVLQLLPHRYPFLFIDRVIELDAGKRVVCSKNLSANEWFFRGHYPGHPVMPGMLIVEAMAQAGGIVILSALADRDRHVVAYFSGIDNVKFRRPLFPGDQMRIEATVLQSRNSLFRFRATVSVGGTLTTEGEVTVAVR